MTADVLRRRLLDKSTFETAVYFDDPAAVRGDAAAAAELRAGAHRHGARDQWGGAAPRGPWRARAQAEGRRRPSSSSAGAKTPRRRRSAASTSPTSTRRGSRAASGGGLHGEEMREGATPYLVEHVRKDGFSLEEARKGEITLQEEDGPVVVARGRDRRRVRWSTRSTRGTRWRRRTRTATGDGVHEAGAAGFKAAGYTQGGLRRVQR